METVGDDRHSSNTFMLIDTAHTPQSILNQSTSIPQNAEVHSELFQILTARPTLIPTPHSEAWDHTCRASGSLGYSTALPKSSEGDWTKRHLVIQTVNQNLLHTMRTVARQQAHTRTHRRYTRDKV